MKLDKNKKIIIAVVAVVVVIAVALGAYFALSNKGNQDSKQDQTNNVSTEAPVVVKNPLTGESGYNAKAVGKRPISVVVENSSAARPQYNINTPDIIVEGEVEGGETRMLWLYSDMTSLPEKVGPTRSARPSFVEFSRFFDSVYIHFGGSHSKDDYLGGYEIIDKYNVDNIDGIKSGAYFKRTTDKKSPHNAVLLGDKVVEAIEKKKYRKELNEKDFTQLNFYDNLTPVSSTACNSVNVKISSRTQTHKLSYDSEKGVYTNASDYKTPVSFANVIVMFADSKYIDKHDYKGAGKTETYLNYNFTSGKGQLASGGAIVDFNWKVENGVLKFTDVNGNDLKLNPGKSWIALASANHEGSVAFE